ncbi:MAG TPA: nuclear transport factor 2 family protein [Gemmatimonadales bacterium]
MTRLRSLQAALAASAVILAAAPAATAAAQQTTSPPQQAEAASTSDDERAVLAVVTGLFDAMRARDTAAIRASFIPGAELTSSSVRDGQPTVGRDSVGSWIASVAGAPPGLLLDERIYSPQVHLSDGLATVWVEYDLYVGERFNHCGVDAFILVRTAEGWKVSSVADTRRREGCPTR